MNTVQDEHHVLFVCPALLHVRSQFTRLFGTGRFIFVQDFFTENPRTDTDWQLVMRDTCRYLDTVGGIYSRITMPAHDVAG